MTGRARIEMHPSAEVWDYPHVRAVARKPGAGWPCSTDDPWVVELEATPAAAGVPRFQLTLPLVATSRPVFAPAHFALGAMPDVPHRERYLVDDELGDAPRRRALRPRSLRHRLSSALACR